MGAHHRPQERAHPVIQSCFDLGCSRICCRSAKEAHREEDESERAIPPAPMAATLPLLLLLVAAASAAIHGGKKQAEGDVNGIPLSELQEFSDEAIMPRFAENIPNVTVTLGKDALLACVVENLRGYKVAWVRVDTQTILSIHHNVITQNPRISLSYNDHRSWYLHITDVQEEDRGWYMCQINTDPMRSRVGYIQVVVPPSILDKETSSDMVVREGSNVSMTCRAEGYPEPYVMWRREDGENINYNGVEANVIDGEVLNVSRVSRLHMGAYLCIASNGVPPTISKRVLLRVQFPPMLSIPNQLEAAYVGQDVSLECHTEAYPTSLNYWITERGDMIVSGDKYEISSLDTSYKKYMRLKIKGVSKRDFVSYKCVAKNSLGETDGVIKLEGRGKQSRQRHRAKNDVLDPRRTEYEYDDNSSEDPSGPYFGESSAASASLSALCTWTGVLLFVLHR
ncbi:lachesin-like isoform X2 [Neocloeon triangulifer]|uniref:lachesin-like isoform X2 n=1 Tax=Neocloeon triangulifer TaxID=2078957 RepID=UPI00286EC920|nr:lachesin-like isoform X2 [Neocloeon triangulifer]